jgi:hypothetical protein
MAGRKPPAEADGTPADGAAADSAPPADGAAAEDPGAPPALDATVELTDLLDNAQEPGPTGYRGRRRRPPPRLDAGVRRRSVVVAAALAVVLVAATVAGAVLRRDPLPQPGAIPTPAAVPESTQAPTEGPEPGASGAPRPSLPRPVAAAPVVSPAAAPPPAPDPGPAGGRSDPPSAPAGPVSYEAEAAQLSGSAQSGSLGGASGGRIVRLIGDSSRSFVRFTGVTVAEAGDYRLTFHYVSGDDRWALVTVNDRSDWVRFDDTDGWETVGTAQFRVELAEGANTIQFGNPFSWAPDLDRITVGPLD